MWARSWPLIVLGTVALMVAVVSTIAIPHHVGAAINALLAPHPEDEVRTRVVIVVALAVLQVCVRVPGTLLLIAAAVRTDRDVRARLFEHLLHQDRAFHHAHPKGDLASRFTNDQPAVSHMWSMGMLWAVGGGMLVLASITMMFSIDVTLALWVLAVLPAGLFVALRLGRVVKQRSAVIQQQQGTFSAAVQEDLAGMGVIRNYGLEGARRERLASRSRALVDARMHSQTAEGAFAPLVSTCTAISMLAVLWIGGNRAIDGQISVGDLVQFSAYLTLIVYRVVGLGDIVSTFQRGAASWSRIAEILATRPTVVDGSGPAFETPVRGELEIRELTIEREGRRLLDRVSLHIPAGTVCALVGRVGSGKSTLLEAIPRLIDAPPGTVFVDGRDVTDLPLASLRSAIAYASQTPFLLSTSIADNIAIGTADDRVDPRRIESAAHVAGLTADLAALPHGLDTQVGERGVTVSGGQRQRIELARAIASERPIVVLDDPLSAVDPATEREILERLDGELKGRTLLLISHRIVAVRRAHQIAVLDAGKLVELGSHDELLARGGLYAQLYRDQLEEDAR